MIFNFWDHIEAEILVRNDDNPNEYKWSKMKDQEPICEDCKNAKNDPMGLYVCNEHGTNIPPGNRKSEQIKSFTLYGVQVKLDYMRDDEIRWVRLCGMEFANVTEDISETHLSLSEEQALKVAKYYIEDKCRYKNYELKVVEFDVKPKYKK